VLYSDLLGKQVFIGTKTEDPDSLSAKPAISPSLLGGNFSKYLCKKRQAKPGLPFSWHLIQEKIGMWLNFPTLK